MAREAEYYRDVLEQLLIYFGNKRVLTAKEVAAHDGCDPRTASKRYDISRDGISIYVLARKMCKL